MNRYYVNPDRTEPSEAPPVGVVVLTYNGWAMTMACLNTLVASSYTNYRIYLVDNASDEDLGDDVKQRFPSVRVIRNAGNFGFSKGVNVGLRAAMEDGAEYIWLLNNDTIVSDDTLGALLASASRDTSIGAVGGVLTQLDSTSNVQAWGGGTVNLWTGIVRHSKRPTNASLLHFINGACMLLRRKALGDVGLFDEHYFLYWEDVDLCFRLRDKGWRLAVAENALVRHSVSGTIGRYSPTRKKYYLASAERFLECHAQLPWLAKFTCSSTQHARTLWHWVKLRITGDRPVKHPVDP